MIIQRFLLQFSGPLNEIVSSGFGLRVVGHGSHLQLILFVGRNFLKQVRPDL